MRVLLLLVSSFIAVQAFSIPEKEMEEWKAYKMEYKKSYSETEDKFRMKVFMDNKREIEEHNARYEKGEVTFTLGLNQFSDMLHSEFLKKYNDGAESRAMRRKTQGSRFIPPANFELPDEVNWVEKGAVTGVRSQGDCRSDWAFSATGALEGQQFLKTGKLVALSNQNLVDCSFIVHNVGCQGGSMDKAFMYVFYNQGINTEESYPYTGTVGNCSYNPNDIGATCIGFADILPANETALQIAVATVGPISAAVDGHLKSFKDYKGGVYSDPYCSLANQAVLVVGYGTDKETNQKYWLVRNSWGESWGEKGYFRIARDAGNMCAIASYASYPFLE